MRSRETRIQPKALILNLKASVQTIIALNLSFATSSAPYDEQVAAFDSYGDGWIDPFGNATAYWELTGKTAQWTGTLLEGHESSRTRVCLPPGKYDFAAPGALAWVSLVCPLRSRMSVSASAHDSLGLP